MKRFNNPAWAAAAFLGFSASVLLMLFWPLRSELRIGDQNTGRLLYRERMHSGEEFVLTFTHSVNRRPVFDTLRVQGDHLVIVGSRFDAFGAGMPEGSSQDGTLSVAGDGWLVYRVERATPDIVVRVGRVAGHQLVVKQRPLPLAQLAPPGTPLRLFVQRFRLIDILKGRYMQWALPS